MRQSIQNFLREEDGQDLIEYSLLITFIAIACMWFVGAGRSSVTAIWTSSNSTVTQAASATSGS